MDVNAGVDSTTLPGGTVTFLFTDIEGSTRLLDRLRDRYAVLLAGHHQIIREALNRWNGWEVDTQGDAFFAAFSKATEAVSAVVDIQRAMAAQSWPDGVAVLVRMGLHTGEPWLAQEGYIGMAVHRAARIGHVGHGGQVLLSETTVALVRDDLPDGVTLLSLGRHRLKDMSRPESIHQLAIEGLPGEFPPLKSLEVLPAIEPVETLATGGDQQIESAVEGSFPIHAPDQFRPHFAGRHSEMDRLDSFLEAALKAPGQPAFVVGDAGSGKTALLRAFADKASAEHDDLLVAWGVCNAFSGRGDPYLPFRDILNSLTGEVEMPLATGAITRQQARRLWEACPIAMASLLNRAPGLLGTLVPAAPLLTRASEALPEVSPLRARLSAEATRPAVSAGELEQSQLFEQITGMLREMAHHRPLVLVLDDLQWVDSGSINLLFHLGRRLAGARVLLIGAYRPQELTSGDDDDDRRRRQLLLKLLDEFRRTHGQIWIDLNQAEGQAFIDSYLDSEANRLDRRFREALFERTGGHPLFTIELLRSLQDRGELILDESGVWTSGLNLDWTILPARVEGVIKERIDQLGEELSEILAVAAVEGETFTAQVVARVAEKNERRLLRTLSRELGKQHQLVTEHSSVKVGRQLLSRYQFTHNLFQRYLYGGLGEVERRLLHGDIAAALEELYAGRSDEIAVQLARHYVESGDDERALPRLLNAGDQALRLYAFEDAIRHYEQALSILKGGGDYEGAVRLLMKLGLTHHSAFNYELARQAYDEGFALQRQSHLSPPAVQLPLAPHPLRIIRNLEPFTFDPSATSQLTAALFSGLLRYTPELDLMPDLAASWSIADGGRTYTFHLRDDVYWSDGRPVAAGDFVFGWHRALDPHHGSPSATVLYDVVGAADRHQGRPGRLGVSAPDAHTLRVELERPSSYFLQVLTHAVAMPVPRHIVEAHGERWTLIGNFVGNGRFLPESWRRGESLMLRRNPTYRGSFQGNLEKVEILFRSDPAKDLELFAAGEVDILDIWHLAPADLRRAMLQFPDNYVSVSSNTTGFVGFEVSRPPFNDPRVRRAFVLATDRRYLVDKHEMGRAFPATGGFVPPGIPGHVPNIALPTDVTEARRLLAQAGYPGGSGFPPLRALLHPDDPVRVGEFIFRPWEANLGVKITWDVLEFPLYMDGLKREKPHLFAYGWGSDYPDPDDYLRVGLQLITDWRDDVFSNLVERARRSMDHQERMSLYRQAEEILVQQAPIMPVLYLRSNFLLQPWVRNVPLRDEISFGYWWDAIVLDPH